MKKRIIWMSEDVESTELANELIMERMEDDTGSKEKQWHKLVVLSTLFFALPAAFGGLLSGITAHQSQLEKTEEIIKGRHVRVGLEDNIFVRRGVRATNVDLVEKVKRLAAEFEREIATPDVARQMLGLKGLEAVNF
jgi:hypothetical protein